MSGVYIPGIEIPTEKPIAILLCTDRSVGLYDVVARQLRHIRECEPAIPVPDHGRLMDADALYEKFMNVTPAIFTTKEFAVMVVQEAVCPTIIPADKEVRNEDHRLQQGIE